MKRFPRKFLGHFLGKLPFRAFVVMSPVPMKAIFPSSNVILTAKLGDNVSICPSAPVHSEKGKTVQAPTNGQMGGWTLPNILSPFYVVFKYDLDLFEELCMVLHIGPQQTQ